MKKLFALIAFVAFFGAIASPAIAVAYSSPIAVKVIDDKPKNKKAKAAAETTKKDTKADCPAAKKSCCESKKECSGAEKK